MVDESRVEKKVAEAKPWWCHAAVLISRKPADGIDRQCRYFGMYDLNGHRFCLRHYRMAKRGDPKLEIFNV